MQQRCPASATDNFNDEKQTDGRHPDSWDAHWTARCGWCGKRIGLYPVGSTLAREAGNADYWRMKTHYYATPRRLTCVRADGCADNRTPDCEYRRAQPQVNPDR